MILPIIFYVSLACIAFLLFTKMREQKTKKQPFLLRIITLGDERIQIFSQKSAHWYADRKDDAIYFFEKQLPIRSKRLWAKTQATAIEKWGILMNDLREMKILKRSEGLSEFFQARDEEKELHEEFMHVASESETEDSQNTENTLE